MRHLLADGKLSVDSPSRDLTPWRGVRLSIRILVPRLEETIERLSWLYPVSCRCVQCQQKSRNPMVVLIAPREDAEPQRVRGTGPLNPNASSATIIRRRCPHEGACLACWQGNLSQVEVVQLDSICEPQGVILPDFRRSPCCCSIRGRFWTTTIKPASARTRASLFILDLHPRPSDNLRAT